MTAEHGALPAVGVLGGTGPLGRGLGLRLAVAGYAVVLGSRSAERAQAAAEELHDMHDLAARGGSLIGTANDAAASCDVVIVAVPYDGVRELIAQLRDRLAGRVVVSCVNPLGFDADGPYPIAVDEGSAAELIAALAPEAQVTAAFHHVPAPHLTRNLEPLDMDVLVTGADDDAVVHRLVEAIDGLRAVPAGALRLTRPVEQLTAAIIAINKLHKTSVGLHLAGLPDRSA